MPWEVQDTKAVAVAGIVEEPGEVPPGPTPEAPTVTPLPEGTGLKPAEVKERAEGFFERHKAIKAAVDKAGYRYLCSTVEKLATELELEPSVVEEHLRVLELDEAGKFMQTPTELDRAFCSVDAMQRLVENLRKLKV